MRYLIITGLLVLATILFGQMVSRFSILPTENIDCLDCDQQTINRNQSNDSQYNNSPRQEPNQTVFFNENRTPVRLVSTAEHSKLLIPVNYGNVYDSLGQKVVLGDRLVVSVFDKRPTKPPVRTPSLTNNRPATISKPVASESYLNSGIISAATTEPSNITRQVIVDKEPMDSSVVVRSKGASLVFNNSPQTTSNEAHKSESVKMSTAVDTANDEVVSKSNMSRYQKVALYTIPAAIGIAALTRSNRNDNAEKTIIDDQALSKISFKRVITNTQHTSSSDTESSDTESSDTESSDTDSMVADQIDDIEDELQNLTDTVDGLGTEVGGVQTNVSTLQDQVATVRAQLGENDVDALASQLKNLESKTYAGIAAAASLVTAIPSEPGKTILNIGSGHYEGETAIGVSLSRRLTTVNGYFYGGIASGISEVKSPLMRVGVGIEF